MRLQEYERKRNFKKTPEPRGGKTASENPPRFVVQEHHASHLHYDFRLEAFGRLKSWAVPKGPPLEPGEKRLAVEVEDHPLDYIDFKGRIPEGEYGAGVVRIWDRGTWVSPENLKENFRKGHLDFELKGKRLKGRYLLQRTKSAPGRKSRWLLIKRHDENPPRRERLKKKIRRQPAVDEVPDFISPQLALLMDAPPEGNNWIHEFKFDGYRTLSFLKGKKVRLVTRNGKDWTERYPEIAKALSGWTTKDAVLDGEVVAPGEKGATDFSELQRAWMEGKGESLVYYVFDLLFVQGRDIRSEPLEIRKQLLRDFLSRHSHPRILYSEHRRGGGGDFLKEACRKGFEGIVSKERSAPYRGGRTAEWQKAKCGNRQEFVVGGFTSGQGAREKFGALLVGVYEDGLFRYAGKVGTGFDAKTIDHLLSKLVPLETGEPPFQRSNPPRMKNVRWVRPQLAVEIDFGSWTRGGLLRHAVFKGTREDKAPRSIHVEKPVAQNKVISPAAESPRISHPDRVIYPSWNITKLDVANYYKSVSPWILPHLKNRPLSLVRCPDRAGDRCFFQKHLNNERLTALYQEELQGQKVSFLNSEEGLLQLVQWGVLELHAWQTRIGHGRHPDQAVFDLDPGSGVPWKKVVETAFEIRDMLKHLGLKSFVKTTGGKGLHVHAPLRPVHDWDDVKAFVKALCLQLETENPGLYLTKASKKDRSGKIFLDYLRNGFGATAVVPYSLRSKDEPTVATPLTWSELRDLESPDEFELRAVLERLARRKTDPWKGFLGAGRTIRLLGSARSESSVKDRS